VRWTRHGDPRKLQAAIVPARAPKAAMTPVMCSHSGEA
jgi:hypothetical protein